MTKNKMITWSVSLLALLLLLAAGWAVWAAREDPEVVRVKELGQQLATGRDKLEPQQREQLWQQLRAARENLTEEQRREIGRSMRANFQAQMEQRINQYFSLPDNEKTAFLDDMIRGFEKRREERGQRDRRGNTRAEPGRGRGAALGGSGPPGGRRDRQRGGQDSEQRTERRRRRLDATSPEQRAKFAQFREDLEKRREELGLPPFRGRGRGRGRF